MRVDGIVARERATVPKKGHATTTSSMKPASSSSPTTLAALKSSRQVPSQLCSNIASLGFRAGGGLAGGMDPTGTNITNEREQWEDAFETFEELKMQWITDRAKVMEVIKLSCESGPAKCVEEVVRDRRWSFRMVEERINGGRRRRILRR